MFKLIGILGRLTAFLIVFEGQDRGSLHFHGLFWGNIPPAFYQFASDKESLIKEIGLVVDSCVKAYVNDNIHLFELKRNLYNKEKSDLRDGQGNFINNNIIDNNVYRGSIELGSFSHMDIGEKAEAYPLEKKRFETMFRNVHMTDSEIEKIFKEMNLFDLHVQLSARNCNFHKHSFTCHKGNFF